MIYRVYRSGIVMRIEGDTQSSFGPSDPAYAEFEQWVADGGEPEREPEPEQTLNGEQWTYFLDLTGYGDLMEKAVDSMPRGRTRATLKAAQQATTYRLPVLLAGVALVRSMGLGLDIPSDEEIAEAFVDAARFEGLGAVLG